MGRSCPLRLPFSLSLTLILPHSALPLFSAVSSLFLEIVLLFPRCPLLFVNSFSLTLSMFLSLLSPSLLIPHPPSLAAYSSSSLPRRLFLILPPPLFLRHHLTSLTFFLVVFYLSHCRSLSDHDVFSRSLAVSCQLFPAVVSSFPHIIHFPPIVPYVSYCTPHSQSILWPFLALSFPSSVLHSLTLFIIPPIISCCTHQHPSLSVITSTPALTFSLVLSFKLSTTSLTKLFRKREVERKRSSLPRRAVRALRVSDPKRKRFGALTRWGQR